MDEVAHWIGRHLGLGPQDTRFQQAVSAINCHARLTASSSIAHYLQLLDRDPVKYQQLIELLTIQESYFFRVPEQFAFIKERLLPEFAATHTPGARFRAWSAGCATGEEAYSLAILLHQVGWLERSQILATDISDNALADARAGLYRPWSFRCEDRWPTLIRHFSTTADGKQAIHPALKKHIRFEELNLLHSSYPHHGQGTCNLDLILCRNVLIYFSQHNAQRVIQKLQACLAPGGWLITGPSDPMAPEADGCETVVTEAGMFYRRKAAQAPDSHKTAAYPPARQPRSDREVAVHRAATTSAPPLPQEHHLSQDALDPEGHYQAGLLAATSGRLEDAVTAFRKALYLDSSLIMVHLNLAAVMERLGRHDDARRAYQHAYRLAAGMAADTPVALGEGVTAGEMMKITRQQMARIQRRGS